MDLELLEVYETFQAEHIDQISKEELLSLFSVPVFFEEKEEKSYIKKVEKIVRGSYEYTVFRKFLYETYDLNKCVFTGEETAKVELHHYPLSLFEITTIVLDTLLRDYSRENINTFRVAEEVMKLHFELKVGLVPLVESLHDKYHKENFPIPKEWIFGNWKYFIQDDCKYVVRQEFKEKLIYADGIDLEVFKDYVKKVNWIK